MFYEWLLWPAVLSTAGRLPSVYLAIRLPVFSTAILRSCQGGPMPPVWMSKRPVSVFINASHCGRKLDKNSLSLSQFQKRGIETIRVLQFLSQHFAYWTPYLCCDFILCSVATFWVMSLVRIYPGRLDIDVNLFLNTWPQLYKRWKGYQLDKSLSLSSG